MENWLNCHAQTVVISSTQHYWCIAGIDTGPILFNIFINYLDDGTECTFSKFAGGTGLGGKVDALKVCAAIQRDLDQLHKWANRSLRCSAMGNTVLHPGRNKPGDEQLEYSFAEKGPGWHQVEHEPTLCSCSKEGQ